MCTVACRPRRQARSAEEHQPLAPPERRSRKPLGHDALSFRRTRIVVLPGAPPPTRAYGISYQPRSGPHPRSPQASRRCPEWNRREIVSRGAGSGRRVSVDRLLRRSGPPSAAASAQAGVTRSRAVRRPRGRRPLGGAASRRLRARRRSRGSSPPCPARRPRTSPCPSTCVASHIPDEPDALPTAVRPPRLVAAPVSTRTVAAARTDTTTLDGVHVAPSPAGRAHLGSSK